MTRSAVMDQSVTHQFFDDFTEYVAAAWTVSNTGVTPTNALTAEDGGVLLNTTTAGATDATFLQKPSASFKFVAGKQAFFKARLKMSDATASDVYAGMIATSATPLAANDGLYFFKATGQTGWILRSSIGGVNTDTALPAALVAANATYLEVGFAFDGSSVFVYFNSPIGTQTFDPATMNRGHVAVFSAAGALTTALVTPSFGVRNGAAAIKTMSVDYVLASFER
jgi:hypothetical protein